MQQATNTGENQTRIPPPANPEIPIFLPAIAYFYLTFNSMSAIYQAYGHGDFPMVAFVAFVYFGHFCLIHCMKQLQDLAPTDTSPRKHFLKSLIWVLSSGILFGFSHQLSTFIHPVAAVFVFATAVSTSYFLFFLYFVHDCHLQPSETPRAVSSFGFRIEVFRVSPPSTSKVKNEGKVTRGVVPGLENV
ncbi:hypothetical protein GQ457_06G041770 [Hibiscus cannabinus]